MQWEVSMKYAIVALLFLVGCNFEPEEPRKPTKQEAATAVRNRTAYKLKVENDLIPCGTGSQMMGQIEMLALAFDYFQPLDIETARPLLITAVDKFLKEINEDESIRSYLNNYPFNPKNIKVTIYLYQSNYTRVPDGDLCVVDLENGKIEYEINGPDDRFHTILEETYDDAVTKLNNRSLQKNESH